MIAQSTYDLPLTPSQRILEIKSGETWRVMVRETFCPDAGRDQSFAKENSRFIYGCECEQYPDERVVYQNQLGSEFVVLDEAKLPGTAYQLN